MPIARVLPVSALFVVLVSARGVSADPITLTSGTLHIGTFVRGDFNSADFTLSGDHGFSVHGSASDGAATRGGVRCANVPCGPSDLVTVPDLLWFNGYGGATIDGTPQGSFVFGGFTFRTPDVPIPANPFDLTLRAPFTATATVGIDGYDGQRRVPGTSVTVQGQGTVTTQLTPAGEGFMVTGYTFDFGAASPTPEPGSLILLATGSMFMMKRLRRRT